MLINNSLIPVSLYVHVPWCIKKCPYCDFNSHTSETLPFDTYVDKLVADLKASLPLINNRPLHSVFIGGGTPSLMPPRQYARFFDCLDKVWGLPSSVEVTMEMNPGTSEYFDLSEYRAVGVNRLSLGAQSFSGSHLQALGRIHDGDEAVKAYRKAVNAGFENINLDIMYGLPNQSPLQAMEDLTKAVSLLPQHISWYELTIEPNTVFYNRPPVLPVEPEMAAMEISGQQLLSQHGYERYEVSAYAKLGKVCEHNLNYWQFGDYVGVGAGAHGKITSQDGLVYRTNKLKQPAKYMASDSELSVSVVKSGELPFEFMLNAMRLTQGFELTAFELRTGQPKRRIMPILKDLNRKGYLELDNNNIQFTNAGRMFANDMIQAFLP